ncbi:Alpha/Beta hydrolase protein [Halteromyces radiatus]|uniref:Alpha/Beta hydrolase protein n=1 Tax=Halteromyces radiatus TaxID=101107 RepID=UPI00221EEE2C|nr:Alpha/Beta hydrolase protein [Halteromyces radiatus]KAI8098535.1 Alpha/Beta hydrolase protein [Halteromyces radiatus]
MTNVQLIHHQETVKVPLDKSTSVSLLDFIQRNCPHLYGPEATYHPTPYLFNGHLQTAYAAYYKGTLSMDDIKYERDYLPMSDGGQIALDWFPALPKTNDQPLLVDTPTLVCLHGLTGGSHESYIRGLLEVVTAAPFNYQSVVINNRGCGKSELKTPHLFCGAYTEDIRVAMKRIRSQLKPGTPMIAIGFSLGANILVKYLGEEGDKVPLTAAISVANPFDFVNSGDLLDKTAFSRRVYSGSMAGNLQRLVRLHETVLEKHDKYDREKVMNATTLREFDEHFTSKFFGYSSASAYYHDASSYRKIENVQIPLLCLNALDDPIANGACLPIEQVKANPNVILAVTAQGGHIGWFEHIRQPSRWMNKPLAEFITAMFQVHDQRSSHHIDPADVATEVEAIEHEKGLA